MMGCSTVSVWFAPQRAGNGWAKKSKSCSISLYSQGGLSRRGMTWPKGRPGVDVANGVDATFILLDAAGDQREGQAIAAHKSSGALKWMALNN